MSPRLVAVAIGVGVLIGVGGTLGIQALRDGGGDSPAPTRLQDSWIQGVDLNDLAGQGLYLSRPPEGFLAKFSTGAAKNAAGKRFSNVTARQVVLAHLETSNFGGYNGQVWIVNFDPNDPDLHTFCPGANVAYELAFVDAETREVLATIGNGAAGTPAGCGGPHGIPLTPGHITTPGYAQTVTPQP